MEVIINNSSSEDDCEWTMEVTQEEYEFLLKLVPLNAEAAKGLYAGVLTVRLP